MTSGFGKTWSSPGGGGYVQATPGPDSDFARSQRLREAADAETAARTAQARTAAQRFGPAVPGQQIPQTGEEAAQQQRYGQAKAARDAALQKIDQDLDRALEEFSSQPPYSTHYRSDPTGSAIKDKDKRTEYITGIANIRQHFQRAYENALLDFAMSMGGGGFGRSFLGSMGSTAGRMQGKELSEPEF
jgi:hypothetical protein